MGNTEIRLEERGDKLDVKLNRMEEEMYRSGNKLGALDSLLNRFNKVVQNAGILKELKERESFEKPSLKRRREQRESEQRRRRRERKEAALNKDPKLEGRKYV